MTNEPTWDSALPDLRAGLLRRARRLGVDADTAQDLAQETLYEAWRLRDRVYDPGGTDKWLAAIFRNVYLRHLKRQGRDSQNPVATDEPTDDFDIEVELERRELAELLDRALALLPTQTRDALVHRFVGELPVGAVAERLGLSEGAVQMRLQRGKLAMRRTLVTEYEDDARAYGLVSDDEAGWQETRIWCPHCGMTRFHGRFLGPLRRMLLDCRNCNGTYWVDGDTIRLGVTGFRSAMRKGALESQEFWRDGIRGLNLHPHRTTIARCVDDRGIDHMDAICERCGFCLTTSLDSQAVLNPLGLQFWRDNPRIRKTTYEPVEAAGIPAVRVAFESVTSTARLDAVVARHDFRLLHIARS